MVRLGLTCPCSFCFPLIAAYAGAGSPGWKQRGRVNNSPAPSLTSHRAVQIVCHARPAPKENLPTCSVFRQTALYGGRNRLQVAV